MSVDLLVERPDGSTRMIPLTSRSEFLRRWWPVTQELGLVWVPLLETGIPLQPDDVPEILAELERMREHIVPLGPDWAHVLEDIRKLSEGLRAVDFAAGETVFVG